MASRGHGALIAAVVAALAVVGASASAGAATEQDVATAYQADAAHDGLQTDATLAPPLAARWTATLPSAASYPVIAAGKVFVTTAADVGSTLYALSQADGHVVWQQPIPGAYHFAAVAYDAGRLFVVDPDGLLQAFDPVTGASLWSASLPGQFMFTSPPSAANGVVYTSGAGSGGTLYAVDEATGALLGTQPVSNGDHSSPALSAGAAFVAYSCDQAYGFAQATLSPLWHHSTSCSGGGGKTAVYAGGRVYIRDSTQGNLVLDAATGATVRSFAAGTAFAPAVDAARIFTLANGVLTEQALDGTPGWTFGGDGTLSSAPILLATGSAEYVVEGSTSGHLYLLDAASGTVAWSATLGAGIAAPDEQNVTQLAGLGAGQGLLVVPAGATVTAFGALPPPTVGAFAPAVGSVGSSVTISGTSLTGATGVTFNGAAATFTVVSDTQITATVPPGATSGPIRVTTPRGTATSSTSFTVKAPDFSLTVAPPGETVVAGSSTTYAIDVLASGGFTGTIAFSVSGLPSGATATFSRTGTTSTTTLTVATARSAKTGTSTLTIRGTSGSLSHTATVTLQITKK